MVLGELKRQSEKNNVRKNAKNEGRKTPSLQVGPESHLSYPKPLPTNP